MTYLIFFDKMKATVLHFLVYIARSLFENVTLAACNWGYFYA